MIKRLLFWGNGEISRVAKSYFKYYTSTSKREVGSNIVAGESIQFLSIIDQEYAKKDYYQDIEFFDRYDFNSTRKVDHWLYENYKTDYFFPSVSFQKRNTLREDVCNRMLEKFGGDYNRFVSHIHPQAVVFPDVVYGYGVWIQELCSIQSGVRIGNGVVCWANSHVGHGSTIENYAWVTTNATICSSAYIKKGAFIGANATIFPEVTVGEHAIIGAGSIITKDVPARTVTFEGRDNY